MCGNAILLEEDDDRCIRRVPDVIDRSEAERQILMAGWLADQSEEVRRAVLKVARLVDYPVGEFLFHAGDDEGGIYGVVSGGVGVHLPSDYGETVLVQIVRRGTWFGYGPMMRPQRRSLSFSLVEPTLLFHLPLSHAQEIMQRSPAHQRALLSIAEYGMDIALRVIGTLMIKETDRRIAATLLQIAGPAVGDGSTLSALVTQSQLGEMANADRRIVNRVLRRFSDAQWLTVTYGGVEIVDRASLAAFARNG